MNIIQTAKLSINLQIFLIIIKTIFLKRIAGGGRTSWEKEWFNSSNPYTTKTDFNREQLWPSPANYRIKSTLANSSQHIYHQSPMHSIGIKLVSAANTNNIDNSNTIINNSSSSNVNNKIYNNTISDTEKLFEQTQLQTESILINKLYVLIKILLMENVKIFFIHIFRSRLEIWIRELSDLQ